jgi:maltokinase
MVPMPAGNVADQLMRYLTGARWFAGKGRQAELDSLTPLPWLTAPGAWPAVRFEIAEVGYGGDSRSAQPTELYSLPVAYRQAAVGLLNHAEIARLRHPDLGEVVAYDAMQDGEACRVILTELLDQAWHREPETQVRFHLSAAEGLRGDLEPHVYTGQQSNTSVMFGDVAMIKVFRRLELGRNLDIEVHDALSRSHSVGVARLYGWAEGSWSSGGETQHADLAMAVEKLTDAHDGWGLALNTLRQGHSFAAEAAALGQALAQTHQALRSAFPTAHLSGAAVADVMRERLRRATDDTPALLPYAAGLEEALGELSGRSLAVQRVHGDFHLGQTLRTPSGWKIIDFEGEPAKSLAERMAPDSVWRDLAGMLRSVDYAAASVPGPDSASWAAECRSAFLEGYAGGDLQPGDAAILRAYEADKAIYEVIYEVRNRPDWVGIPLAAVATLVETPKNGTTTEPPDSEVGHRPTTASRAHERRSTDGIRSER